MPVAANMMPEDTLDDTSVNVARRPPSWSLYRMRLPGVPPSALPAG
jgi:hypothetical protein